MVGERAGSRAGRNVWPGMLLLGRGVSKLDLFMCRAQKARESRGANRSFALKLPRRNLAGCCTRCAWSAYPGLAGLVACFEIPPSPIRAMLKVLARKVSRAL